MKNVIKSSDSLYSYVLSPTEEFPSILAGISSPIWPEWPPLPRLFHQQKNLRRIFVRFVRQLERDWRPTPRQVYTFNNRRIYVNFVDFFHYLTGTDDRYLDRYALSTTKEFTWHLLVEFLPVSDWN